MSTTMLVRDHNGQALAISTFEDEPGRRAAASLLDVAAAEFELGAVATVDRTETISCGRRLGATVSRCYRPNKELSLTAPAARTG